MLDVHFTNAGCELVLGNNQIKGVTTKMETIMAIQQPRQKSWAAGGGAAQLLHAAHFNC